MLDLLDVHERQGFGLATVMARSGVSSERIGEALGVAMAEGPKVAGSAQLRLIANGPGSWLAFSQDVTTDWSAELAIRLAGLASVSDQSGGYTILTLSGAMARDVLQRGAFVDLHRDRFGPGSVATTVIAHMGVILWQIDDNLFEVAFFRSFAASFRDWIDQTVAGLASPSR